MGILDGLITGYTNAILGPAPTDVGGAYSKLQTELNSKYEKNKQAFEADPANAGKAFQMPDALQRWNDQIQGMMTSGDPVLQKEALEQMNDYYKRATDVAADNTPTSMREFTLAQQNPEYADYLAEKQRRGGTNVNVNIPQGEKWVPLDKLGDFTQADGSPIPPGTTYDELRAMGAMPVQTQQQVKSGVGTDLMVSSMKDLRDSIDTAPTATQQITSTLRNMTGLPGAAANIALNAMGNKATVSDTKFNNSTRMLTGQITNLMNGAGASEGERDYWASLQAQVANDPITRRIKYNAMVDFANTMANRARKAGVADVPDLSEIQKFKIDEKPKKSAVRQSIDNNLGSATKPKSNTTVVNW